MTGPLILAFDTAGPYCAAALVRGGSTLASEAEPMTKGQAERLMPFLEEMLSAHGVTWSDLTALGVGVGPGNFTGIRIAVASARGLALSLGVPAHGVNGFDARRHLNPDAPAVIPAPRGQVYAMQNGMPVQIDGDAPAQPAPADLALAIAQVTLTRLGQDTPRPAPLYVRPADAAPPKDAPPVIIP